MKNKSGKNILKKRIIQLELLLLFLRIIFKLNKQATLTQLFLVKNEPVSLVSSCFTYSVCFAQRIWPWSSVSFHVTGQRSGDAVPWLRTFALAVGRENFGFAFPAAAAHKAISSTISYYKRRVFVRANARFQSDVSEAVLHAAVSNNASYTSKQKLSPQRPEIGFWYSPFKCRLSQPRFKTSSFFFHQPRDTAATWEVPTGGPRHAAPHQMSETLPQDLGGFPRESDVVRNDEWRPGDHEAVQIRTHVWPNRFQGELWGTNGFAQWFYVN